MAKKRLSASFLSEVFDLQILKTLVIHFARLGPYHLARLESAVEVLGPLGWKVVALESAGADATYDWERTEGGGAGFSRRTVFPDGVFENIPAGEMRRGIFRALGELRPDAVAVAGWGTPDARACLAWCKRNRVRAIVMSETRAADGRRVWWREWVKSRIVRRFDGALCGGESHRRYLIELGMSAERIATGYNVVDNGFFSGIRNAKWVMRNGEGVERGGGSVEGLASDAGSPAGPYFLASNRFVERKNLGRLIRAYAKYVGGKRGAGGMESGEGGGVWPLVLLGDGELRGELQALCAELGVDWEIWDSKLGMRNAECEMGGTGRSFSSEGLVVFAGFRQIGELPGFYAGAGVFVHPALEEPWGLVINEAMASGLPVISSRNVGAAEELVVEGRTGFLFDPWDVEDLAAAMRRIAEMPEEERLAMGRAARERVEAKVPKRAFGEGLASLLP